MNAFWPPPQRVLLPVVLVAVVLFVGSAATVVQVRGVNTRVEAAMRDRAAVVGTIVGAELEARFRNREPGGLRRAVTTLAADPRLLAGLLVGPGDTVIVATEILLDGRLAPARLREVLERRRGARDGGLAGGTAVTDDGRRVIGVYPVRIPAAGAGVLVSRRAALVLEYDLTPQKALAMRSAVVQGLLALGIAAAAAVLLWWYLSRTVTGRMRALVRRTRRIGPDGASPDAIEVAGTDELATLSRAVGDLAGRIRDDRRALRRREAVLSAVSYVAQRVLEEDRPAAVMNDVLRALGTATSVSRVYLFENLQGQEGGLAARYTHEWCAPDADPQIDVPALQAMPYEPVFARWLAAFRTGDAISGDVASFPAGERGVLQPQGILALTAVPIMVRGQLWGFMGFDNCASSVCAAVTEVEALKAAANIVGTAIERMRAEEALRRSGAQLRNAQRIARLGYWEWDIPSNEIEWSEEAYSIYGVTPHTFVPSYESFCGLLQPDELDQYEEDMGRALQAGGLFEMEHRIVRPDGSARYVYGVGNVVHDADGRPIQVSGTVQDVTERRLADEERLRLEGQLRQSQKLEAVGQLSGGIAHDFNNLLAVILANAELIGDALANRPDAPRSELADLESAARSGAELVKGLLGFSRRAELRMEALRLDRVARDTSGLLRRLIPENIAIGVHGDEDVPPVLADPGAVQQVLMNLVSNARDAIDGEGGRIDIRISRRAIAGGPDPLFGDLAPGYYGVVSVTDSGCGMPAETLERIFEPFFTTKGPGEGTGLGLAMVHGLVRQHGGALRVVSAPGNGTAVHIALPGATADARASGPFVAPDLVSTGEETILLVEDQESLRRTATRVLERVGYRVVTAENGLDALRAFARHRDTVDLVVSDLVMPEMGGLELRRRLIEHAPGLRFLFMSGYTARDVADRSELPPRVPYLSKPWTIAEFTGRIRQALETDTVESDLKVG